MFCSGPFENLSWQVETATTAEEALAKFDGEEGEEEGGFDLVVFDENMAPKGDLLGTEATKILRKKDESMLIVGLTETASTKESKEKSLESGQDLLWLKPMPPAESVLKDVMRALAKRRLEASLNRVEEAGGRVRGRLEMKHEKLEKRERGTYNSSRSRRSFSVSAGAKVAAET
jgi:DNA-binding response OmpR family regulator